MPLEPRIQRGSGELVQQGNITHDPAMPCVHRVSRNCSGRHPRRCGLGAPAVVAEVRIARAAEASLTAPRAASRRAARPAAHGPRGRQPGARSSSTRGRHRGGCCLSSAGRDEPAGVQIHRRNSGRRSRAARRHTACRRCTRNCRCALAVNRPGALHCSARKWVGVAAWSSLDQAGLESAVARRPARRRETGRVADAWHPMPGAQDSTTRSRIALASSKPTGTEVCSWLMRKTWPVVLSTQLMGFCIARSG